MPLQLVSQTTLPIALSQPGNPIYKMMVLGRRKQSSP